MKYKIVQNEGRKSLTVIISPVHIGYVKYLFEKFTNNSGKEKYFASGVLKDCEYKADLTPFLKEVVEQLSACNLEIANPYIGGVAKLNTRDILHPLDREI